MEDHGKNPASDIPRKVQEFLYPSPDEEARMKADGSRSALEANSSGKSEYEVLTFLGAGPLSQTMRIFSEIFMEYNPKIKSLEAKKTRLEKKINKDTDTAAEPDDPHERITHILNERAYNDKMASIEDELDALEDTIVVLTEELNSWKVMLDAGCSARVMKVAEGASQVMHITPETLSLCIENVRHELHADIEERLKALPSADPPDTEQLPSEQPHTASEEDPAATKSPNNIIDATFTHFGKENTNEIAP